MKQSILVVVVTLCLTAGSAGARPPLPSGEALPPVPPAPLVPDTLFLFAASGPGSYGSPGTDERGFTFDGPGGTDAAGWFGVDLTESQQVWWHVSDTQINAGSGTDMSQALPFDPLDESNDYALWCGANDQCGWGDSAGYGNHWSEIARVDLSGHLVETELTVDFAYRADFEGDVWDWFELRVDSAGTWKPIYRNNLTGERVFREYSFSVPVAELGGISETAVGFFFSSDSAWSDEDGLYNSDFGAVWLDNLRIAVDGVEVFSADFEDGLEPPGLELGSQPGAGLHAELYTELYQEDPGFVNDTAAWAFFADGHAHPDYPGSVIAYGPPYVHEAIQSPLLSVDQHGNSIAIQPDDQVYIYYWMYADDWNGDYLDEAEHPWVAAAVGDQECRGPFRLNTFTFWPDWWGSWYQVWEWANYELEESANAAGGGVITGIAVRLYVYDYFEVWGEEGETVEHNPFPYYDNVRVMVIRDVPVSVDEVPGTTALLGAHPNPFNPSTTIRFRLAADEHVHLTVHDIAGRTVKVLRDDLSVAGDNAVVWDGRDSANRELAAGIYLLRFAAGSVNETRKLVLVK